MGNLRLIALNNLFSTGGNGYRFRYGARLKLDVEWINDTQFDRYLFIQRLFEPSRFDRDCVVAGREFGELKISVAGRLFSLLGASSVITDGYRRARNDRAGSVSYRATKRAGCFLRTQHHARGN